MVESWPFVAPTGLADKRKQLGAGQVWLGTRLRCFFGISLRYRGSRQLRRDSGRAPSETRLHGRIEIAGRALWAEVAAGGNR